jgi:hypothetical protein
MRGLAWGLCVCSGACGVSVAFLAPSSISGAGGAGGASLGRSGTSRQRIGGGVRAGACRPRPWALHSTSEEEYTSYDVNVSLEVAEAYDRACSDTKQATPRGSKGVVLAVSPANPSFLQIQVAYDRRFRLFSSRSVAGLKAAQDLAPEDATFIFSGLLQPKHVKRLLAVRNLQGAVVADVEGLSALQEGLDAQQQRLGNKRLTKVSASREKFLTAELDHTSPNPQYAPQENLRVYISVRAGDDPTSLETVRAISALARDQCPNIDIVGLWADGGNPSEFLEILKEMDATPELSSGVLELALPFTGTRSMQWAIQLPAAYKRRILWVMSLGD